MAKLGVFRRSRTVSERQEKDGSPQLHYDEVDYGGQPNYDGYNYDGYVDVGAERVAPPVQSPRPPPQREGERTSPPFRVRRPVSVRTSSKSFTDSSSIHANENALRTSRLLATLSESCSKETYKQLQADFAGGILDITSKDPSGLPLQFFTLPPLEKAREYVHGTSISTTQIDVSEFSQIDLADVIEGAKAFTQGSRIFRYRNPAKVSWARDRGILSSTSCFPTYSTLIFLLIPNRLLWRSLKVTFSVVP